MSFIYTSFDFETTAYMKLEVLVEKFGAKLARVENSDFRVNERYNWKKKTMRNCSMRIPFIWDYFIMYHCYIFLLCPATLGFQMKMLLFRIFGGTLSLKAGWCQKAFTVDLVWRSTLKL